MAARPTTCWTPAPEGRCSAASSRPAPLAPTAAQAEVLAKAAILGGPHRAAQWLRHGGVIVFDDGSYVRLEAAASAAGAPTRAPSQPTMSSSTVSRSGSLRISWKRPS